MDKQPLVSIVMITYNHQQYIEKAIEGIFMQKCNFNIELIIADDHSTDNTSEIILKCIKSPPNNINVRYTRHKKNKGMKLNSIWALNEVNGYYTAICEGDDYWIDPLKLQKQVDFMKTSSNCKLCVTNAYYYYMDTNTFKNFKIPNKFINKKTLKINPKFIFSKKGVVFPTASYLFRTKEIIDNHLYEILDKLSVVDRCIQLRAIKDGDICNLPDATTVYRVTFKGNSWTSKNINKYDPKKIDEVMNIKDYIYHDFLNNSYNKFRKYDDSMFIANQIYSARIKGKSHQISLCLKYLNKINFKDWVYLLPRLVLK